MCLGSYKLVSVGWRNAQRCDFSPCIAFLKESFVFESLQVKNVLSCCLLSGNFTAACSGGFRPVSVSFQALHWVTEIITWKEGASQTAGSCSCLDGPGRVRLQEMAETHRQARRPMRRRLGSQRPSWGHQNVWTAFSMLCHLYLARSWGTAQLTWASGCHSCPKLLQHISLQIPDPNAHGTWTSGVVSLGFACGFERELTFFE